MAQATGNTITGSFTGTGASDHFVVRGGCQIILTGTWTATVKPECSADASTYVVPSLPDGTTEASYTANRIIQMNFDVPTAVRLNCTAYTSGTLNYTMRKTSKT